MKQNKFLTIFTLLFIFLTIFSSCKRNGVQEPNPFGPSTYSILLHLEAAPNVIFAGNTRESTTVTATLKQYDGVPIANKVVHFDIRDATGNKANLGFFEGNESVKTKSTNQNGQVSVSYYGPFSQELTADSTIYIAAVVAWEGNEFIDELAPIYLIREAVDLTFTLIANPNVLFVTESHPQSQLKAYFKTVDGVPLAGRKIYFEILSGSGTFTDDERKTFVLTDANGYAAVSYVGPTKNEIENNQVVTIQGSPETATPFEITEEVEIRLIIEEATSTPLLQLEAAPNVLIAGDTRESTTVTATLIRDYNVPVANTDVHFSIRDDAGDQINLGYFEGNTAVKTETTDQNGMVSVTYYGPLSHEVTADTTIYIDARVAWSGSNFINEQTPILLIRRTTPNLKLTAIPNVLQAADTNASSTITATLKHDNGTPVANTDVHFSIRDAAGDQINLGYFGWNQSVISETTDGNGMVSVIYHGPLNTDLTADTTIYIKATVPWEDGEIIEESTPILLIRDGEPITTPTLELIAMPNVLQAGSTSASSTITATLKQDNGTPVANTDVHFSIRDAAGDQINLGYFGWNQSVISETTDGNGMVSVIYHGPLNTDLTADTTIYIKATVPWEDGEIIEESTPILLIRDVVDQTFTLPADPNVPLATESRPHSQLKAYIKAADGIPFAGRKVDILQIREE